MEIFILTTVKPPVKVETRACHLSSVYFGKLATNLQ